MTDLLKKVVNAHAMAASTIMEASVLRHVHAIVRELKLVENVSENPLTFVSFHIPPVFRTAKGRIKHPPMIPITWDEAQDLDEADLAALIADRVAVVVRDGLVAAPNE